VISKGDGAIQSGMVVGIDPIELFDHSDQCIDLAFLTDMRA
jgi:hypothetical protein